MKIPFKSMHPKTGIAAVGSALVDMCLLEDDRFLAESGAKKGGMVLVDSEFIGEMLRRSNNKAAIVPGGSACNTIVGIGKLGGKSRFIGKRGNDELGSFFENGLRNNNVEPILMKSQSPTGHVLSIITPDAQRSMFTFLGASAETAPEEISEELFENTALVHIEGYLLFNPKLMIAALKAAKNAGAMISLDLASYTVVESSRELLEEICASYIDILIANEDEAFAFTGHKDELKALSALSSIADLAVVKIGKRGSLIGHGGSIVKVKPMGEGSAVIDTTGAGDLWAAGFLYGLVHGYTLERCGELGSACGYEVCRTIGASIPEDGWQRIKILL
jgi:sugar/nucleoside kinase (ribokinase family)